MLLSPGGGNGIGYSAHMPTNILLGTGGGGRGAAGLTTIGLSRRLTIRLAAGLTIEMSGRRARSSRRSALDGSLLLSGTR